MTREFLSSHGLEVINRDCTNDPEAAAELRALGIKALPVSVRGETVVVGYDADELRKAFGIKGRGEKPLPPEKLLHFYRAVFDALRRAVRQIPQEKLDWVSPKRPRSLRALTWHSFERPDLCIEAAETGAYTEEMVRRYETLAENYHTGEDICTYADEAEARIADFLTRRPDALAKKVSSYMGPITVHKLMELALGHAIQHLRQTYHYFGLLGIEPDRPLPPEAYAEVPVPEDIF